MDFLIASALVFIAIQVVRIADMLEEIYERMD